MRCSVTLDGLSPVAHCQWHSPHHHPTVLYQQRVVGLSRRNFPSRVSTGGRSRTRRHHHIQPGLNVACPIPDDNDFIPYIERVDITPARPDCPDTSALRANEGPGWSHATEGMTAGGAARSTQCGAWNTCRQHRGSVIIPEALFRDGS